MDRRLGVVTWLVRCPLSVVGQCPVHVCSMYTTGQRLTTGNGQRTTRAETTGSGEDGGRDLAGDIGETEVASAVVVGELLVVEAHQVQDRRVQVMDVHAVLDGGDAELIGGAVNVATLDAASGQPHREAGAVVIAALRPL